jgi:MarR family transcriptional regulator, transcriptional regulator for hemolysin
MKAGEFMADNFDQALGFVIHDVARMLRWEFDRRAQTIGLTRSQWFVLAFLLREDGVQQQRLAELMELTPITMTGLLDRLERDGWVERRPDPDDRRAKRIYLTKKVLPVLKKIRALGKEVRESAVAGLTETEQQNLIALLLKVRTNLSAK